MLEPGDAVDRLVVAGRVLLSLSSGGKYLRGWSLKDGTLLWEAVTYTAAAPSAEAAMERGADRGVDLLPLGRDADGDGAEDVLVLARGEVQMRSLADHRGSRRQRGIDDGARRRRRGRRGFNRLVVGVRRRRRRRHRRARPPGRGGDGRELGRDPSRRGRRGRARLDAGAEMTVSATDATKTSPSSARRATPAPADGRVLLFVLDLGKLRRSAARAARGKTSRTCSRCPAR